MPMNTANGKGPLGARTAVAVALVMILAGCQSGKPSVTNATFMGLWNTYDHCQSSGDLDTMRQDVTRLSEGSHHSAVKDDVIIRPLLKPIEAWITPPVPRLAADPRAMAASCSLRTGEAALAYGRPDIATEMFTSVIQNYPQPQYAYYVGEARNRLGQLDQLTQVSLSAIPTIVPLPSLR
jgi:hypothetical protein